MNINGDVHFEGWPKAVVKDFTDNMEPGFCVLCLVDTDQQQHQLFLKPEHLSRTRLVAAAFNGDLIELRRLLDEDTLVAELDTLADDAAEAAKPDAYDRAVQRRRCREHATTKPTANEITRAFREAEDDCGTGKSTKFLAHTVAHRLGIDYGDVIAGLAEVAHGETP